MFCLLAMGSLLENCTKATSGVCQYKLIRMWNYRILLRKLIVILRYKIIQIRQWEPRKRQKRHEQIAWKAVLVFRFPFPICLTAFSLNNGKVHVSISRCLNDFNRLHSNLQIDNLKEGNRPFHIWPLSYFQSYRLYSCSSHLGASQHFVTKN